MRPNQKSARVALVIPVINEGETIAGVVGAVSRDFFDEIIVVDGGSRDDTVVRAEPCGQDGLHDQRRRVALEAGDAACLVGGVEIGRAGPCHTGDPMRGQSLTVTGVPNPNYRPTINEVGRRFYVDASNTFDIFASGVLMF